MLDTILKSLPEDELKCLKRKAQDYEQWLNMPELQSEDREVVDRARHNILRATLMHEVLGAQVNNFNGVSHLAAMLMPRDHRTLQHERFQWLLECLKALGAEFDAGRTDSRNHHATWCAKKLVEAYNSIDHSQRPKCDW